MPYSLDQEVERDTGGRRSSSPSVSSVRRRIAVSAPSSLRSLCANLITSASWSLPANTMITFSICCACSPAAGRCAGAGRAGHCRAGRGSALTYRHALSCMIVLTVRDVAQPGDGLEARLGWSGLSSLLGNESGLLDRCHVLGDHDVDVVAGGDQEVEAGDAVDLEGNRLLARLRAERSMRTPRRPTRPAFSWVTCSPAAIGTRAGRPVSMDGSRRCACLHDGVRRRPPSGSTSPASPGRRWRYPPWRP